MLGLDQPRTLRGLSVPLLVCAALLGGCGSTHSTAARPAKPAIESYLRQVEPVRLAVNALLGRADPILQAYQDGRTSPAQAARRMGSLERRFAEYTVDIAEITPATAPLRALQAEYARTYVLEDAYLSALASGLAERELGNLPNTQAAQRAAIIGWRTGLTVLAREAHLTLPADLQQAGRGEIAPEPGGS
jgi:hypothetical protein